VLRLRAIFEPKPLYRVLGREGFSHWTERLADDDWRVWFYRESGEGTEGDADQALTHAPDGTTSPMGSTQSEEARQAPNGSPGPTLRVNCGTPAPEHDDIHVLDVRGLEPPEPMVRTLEALTGLARGHTLVQLNVRVPRFLLPELESRGFAWTVREEDDDLVRVFIRHAEETPVLDVRLLPSPQKHPTIFDTFDGLAPGQAFVLLNDHDPVPLRYQLQAERPDAFSWEYLEEGPARWQVRIGRTA
jgi:uncharacterized protein (DUF2249 family)